MIILDFEKKHLEEARQIAMANYNEEKVHVPMLPDIDILPDLTHFADNGLGVVAFDKGKMIGFLCCYKPWDNAFNTAAKGTFSPIHAHGAILENREMIYKKLYQVAAEKWIKHKISYHAIGLYAHDNQAVHALFTYGFGLRCIDSIRPMNKLDCQPCDDIVFKEIEKKDVNQVRDMRRMLSEHLGESPCFMYSTPQNFENWIERAERRDSRLFVAKQDEKLIAFLEVKDNAENFVTEVNGMINICGAYCIPEFRGKDIFSNLINYMIMTLETDGYKRLGVDFESFNPTASGFWLKHFAAYTNSVVRRIDECAIHN
ncbi:MAG TPA: GNAT family N-acetyltransferase [Clostridiales bacterium]|nr:GNAT family N-acetyltransferase [Clostridiales bacterium]